MSARDIEKIFAGPAGWAIALGVGGIVLYFVYNRIKKDAGAVANYGVNSITGQTDFFGNSTRGTPYQDAGVVGALGSTVNKVTGGSSQSFGEWLGDHLYDWTHSAYDPNAATGDRNSPPPSGATIATSPLSWQPVVLPYSYKQATIDAPALYGTDALLTPSYDMGSSGSYADDAITGTAVGPSVPGYAGLA